MTAAPMQFDNSTRSTRSDRLSKTLILVSMLMSLCAAESPAADRVAEIHGATMGTSYHVKFVGDVDAGSLKNRIDGRLAEINNLMSTYIEDSEVSRFNRAPANQWFTVSPETLRVIQLSREISRRTSGAFDITVAPLVRLWNFGADAATASFTPPDAKSIEEAMQSVGWSKLELQRDPPALRKTSANLEIDLSAIAKGYGVDQLAQLLEDAELSDYMVEIGGEVRVSGRSPKGRWRIGVEAPDASQRRVATVLKLSDQALASSGDYRNFHEHQGKRYSHTIDPRTGSPVSHQLTAVSIVSDDCATADALATALLVLGPDQGMAWAEEQGLPAIFFNRTENGIARSSSTQMESQELIAEEIKAASGASVWQMIIMAILVFGIATLAMSIGVLFGRSRIKGSCGGLAGLRDENGETLCQACTNPTPECQGEAASPDYVDRVESVYDPSESK